MRHVTFACGIFCTEAYRCIKHLSIGSNAPLNTLEGGYFLLQYRLPSLQPYTFDGYAPLSQMPVFSLYPSSLTTG